MAEDDPRSKVLFFILIGVVAFASGLLGIAIIIILLSALGIFAV